MPEPREKAEETEGESKGLKILDFFKTTIKETKKEKVKPLTKIIVRRLPPRLTKEEFITAFTLPPHDYFHFVRGDLSLGPHAFSRAYINFTNIEDIYKFKESYDDHTLSDEQGREYHAVVEWAPVQRIPKKNSQKKKPVKGDLETDPKYIEFLAKLEEQKNAVVNTSEYFLETDNTPTKEAKITTTPLLEFIKLKRQKKLEMRAESRLKKREAEKERRRREDELRKSEKLKKAKEDRDKKATAQEPKESVDEKEVKNKKIDSTDEKKDVAPDLKEEKEKKKDNKSPRYEKIEKRETKSDHKDEKPNKRERRPVKTSSSEVSTTKRDRDKEKEEKRHIEPKSPKKEVVEEKAIKGEEKPTKVITPSRKSAPASEPAVSESTRPAGPKSRFRYSEQRNRDREVRSQKQCLKEKSDESVVEKQADDKVDGEVAVDPAKEDPNEAASDPEQDEPEGSEKASFSGRKDPRSVRRIRNKDRPAMEIYRPGMGKFSKQRMEQKKDEPRSGKGSSATSEVDEAAEPAEVAVKSATFSRSVSK